MTYAKKHFTAMVIGVGDGGWAGEAAAPPPKFGQKLFFSGKNRVKFGHFVIFSGIRHVKFGNFVNFSGKYHLKFGHFVNFFGHTSCKIREFC